MKIDTLTKITIASLTALTLGGVGIAYFGNEAKANEPTLVDAPSVSQRVLPNTTQILSFNDILKEPMNAVVNISTKTRVENNQLQMMLNDPFFQQFFGKKYGNIPKEQIQRGLGSGVILTSNGYIITNNHVVDGANEIKVSLQNSKKVYNAKVIGVDKGSDLAVIKIDASGLAPIKLANMSDVRVGDIVFAIGNPFGVGETVTQGIVSALNKHGLGINQYENFIQTDASINPGNSGGALVDSRGYLIGINSAIFSKGGGNDGIGFTIPVDMVKNIFGQIVKDGKVKRGYMGVNLSPLDDSLAKMYRATSGAVVAEVEANSPAAKAGLQRGDLITAVNGVAVDSPETLSSLVGDKKPDETVTISLERNKSDKTISLKLTDRDKALSEAYTTVDGLKLSSISPTLQEQLGLSSNKGALVVDVDPSSKGANAGFEKGDVIVQIENSPITSPNDAKNALQSGSKHRVYVNRQGVMGIMVL